MRWIPYLHLSRSADTEAEQKAALGTIEILRSAVLGPAWFIDRGPVERGRREDAIRVAAALGTGIAVARLARIARGGRDALETVLQLGRAGAPLYICDTGQTIGPVTDPEQARAVAARIAGQRLEERDFKRNDGAIEANKKRRLDDPVLRERAEALWRDPSVPVERIEAETGISERTLYDAFGRRTTDPLADPDSFERVKAMWLDLSTYPKAIDVAKATGIDRNKLRRAFGVRESTDMNRYGVNQIPKIK